MYEYSLGVDQDYKLACELYQSAADQGHANALNNLAEMYYCGKGVSEDRKQAGELYRSATIIYGCCRSGMWRCTKYAR